MATAANLVSTTAAAMTLPQAASVITWLANGHPEPMPDAVALALAAAIVPFVHLVCIAIAALAAKFIPEVAAAETTNAQA